MSVKKRELLDQARLRKGAWALQRRMVRCPNDSCLALNSPKAESCWHCGADMKGQK